MQEEYSQELSKVDSIPEKDWNSTPDSVKLFIQKQIQKQKEEKEGREREEKEKENKERFIKSQNRIKDYLILLWILVLLSLSTLAIGGTISRLFELFLGYFVTRNILVVDSQRVPKLKEYCEVFTSDSLVCSLTTCDDSYLDTPSDYLNCYISKKYGGSFIDEVPPIGSVLDSLQVNVSWRDLEAIKQVKGDHFHESKYKYKGFKVLFEIIETKLIAIATDNLQDINNLVINTEEVLPATFRFVPNSEKFESLTKSLPLEVRNWVITERKRRKQLELIDTFVLLIMLGALGSIIFLIGDRIRYQGIKAQQDDAKSVISYIYRPIFGMLLALATFILAASVNGVTSTAKLEDLRTESILFLAFSAGLLTDKVYDQIIRKAEDAIEAKSSVKTKSMVTKKNSGFLSQFISKKK